MNKKSVIKNISLTRSGPAGFLSSQSIGTDALNALNSIKGLSAPQIVHESESIVKITYLWSLDEKFDKANEVLYEFGLRIADE